MKQNKRGQKTLPPSRALPAAGAALLCVLALWLISRPKTIELPYLTAQYIAVMDQNTGKFVYEKDIDQPRSPASLTKLMTLFVVLDDIKSGALHWEDETTILPQEAHALGSKYGMTPGEVLTVEQLVAGTLLRSGCDCVQTLVRLTAGNEPAFVERMNQKAQELGLKGSRFANATGIDAAGHYMTAENIAQLTRALLETHPELLELSARQEVEIGGRVFENMHRLVGRDSRVKGLKTGTTTIGGYNLVTLAQQGEESYIIVLLDSNNDSTRFSETAAIVNTLFGEE